MIQKAIIRYIVRWIHKRYAEVLADVMEELVLQYFAAPKPRPHNFRDFFLWLKGYALIGN